MNFARALDAIADADPGRIAIHGDGGSLTRGELREAIVAAAATASTTWSVGRGDRVGYLGHNRVEALVLLFALARIGAVFVPLNTRLAVGELVAIVEHAQLCALVSDEGHRDIAAAIATLSDLALHAIDALSTGAPDGADAIEVADDDPLLLVYTAGTTGTPKGAVHTHGGMRANADAAVRAHDLDEHDRVLSVLPLFHVGGLCIQTLPALLTGATLVLHPRFDAGAWLHAIATMRPTLTLMVPATLRAALAHPAWGGTDLSCLRVLMTGSSTIPRGLIDAVHARDVPLGQIYGSTETGPVTVALKAGDAVRKAGCAGWPCFAGSVRLVDGDGADVVAGAVGEIVVRAPNVMRGYWREPPTTGFRDGWFATGDLGRCDEDGCLEVVGRNRDLIISGGENVYPAEVEDVLLSVPGVVEAAVIGMPDAQWGEVPAAFVVRGEGVALDATAIASAFDGRLARFKQPKRIVFVDRLPRNAMGKVQAHRLRDLLTSDEPS